jgi:uncharacterized membrane protein YbhN (UPF0104 family)
MNDTLNSNPGEEEEVPSIPPGNKKKKLVIAIGEKVLLLIILALAVFYFLPQISSLEKSLKVLSSLKYWALLLALAAQMMSYYGSGLTISKCVNLSGKNISILRGMLIYLASTSIGLVAGGMFGSTAGTFRWVKAAGGDNEGASLAASLPPVFLDIVLVFVSIIGLYFCFLYTTFPEARYSSF